MSIETAIWRVDGEVEPISMGGFDYESRLEDVGDYPGSMYLA